MHDVTQSCLPTSTPDGPISISAAAELLGLTSDTIRAAISAGHLPEVVTVDDLKRWLRSAEGMHAFMLENEQLGH